MKKIIKLLPLLVILTVFLIGFFAFWIPSGERKMRNYENASYESCVIYLETGEYPNLENHNQDFLEKFKPWESCEELTASIKHYGASAPFIMNTIYRNIEMVMILTIISVIIIPLLYKYCKMFKSKHLKNLLVREEYKKVIKNIFIDAYKFVWVLPVALIIIYLFCLCVAGHADMTYESMQDPSVDAQLLSNASFYIKYLLVNTFYALSYVNLTLIVLSKNKEFIISVIASFILIVLWWYVLEFTGMAFYNLGIVHTEEYFWSLNVLSFDFYYNLNMNIFVLIPVISFAFSFVLATSCYQNKEKLIRMCEK